MVWMRVPQAVFDSPENTSEDGGCSVFKLLLMQRFRTSEVRMAFIIYGHLVFSVVTMLLYLPREWGWSINCYEI